jgi:hypothetical protein
VPIVFSKEETSLTGKAAEYHDAEQVFMLKLKQAN